MRSCACGSVDVLQRLHQVAEHRALGAARGLHLLLQLLLVIGLALGAHDDDGEFLVVVDAGDHVVGEQHVLVEQVAEREIFRIVVDRHGGHDLLRIEEDRERALDRDGVSIALAGLIDAGDALGEPRIRGSGRTQVAGFGRIRNVRPCPMIGAATWRLQAPRGGRLSAWSASDTAAQACFSCHFGPGPRM